MSVRVDHLLCGPVADLGDRGARSGIDKQLRSGPVWLSREGLAGDGQADLRFHGGVEKALHHYPHEHYDAWRSEMASARLGPGGFGENLSTVGLAEKDVAVGDVFRLGEAVVEVTQGRQPCWKLNLRFGRPDMAARVQASGRMGWYYRVLQPGAVQAGDELVRLERRSPQWTIARLWRILYVTPLDRDELAAMSSMQALPPNWRGYAQARLETGQVEDWRRRLETPAAFA